MTKFQQRLKAILTGKFEFSKEEIELENNIWHNRIIQCWNIDTEAEPTEEENTAKQKFKEYQHEYYITHRKKPSTKTIDMSERGIKARASMSKLRNRECLYENEIVKYGTLVARMHNQMGYSYHDAKIIADNCLIKESKEKE